MNNKGFAITTILYGIMIIFVFLLMSLIGIMSVYKNNLEKLIESNNGSRSIITIKKNTNISANSISTKRELVCLNNTCEYYRIGETITSN